MKQIPQSNDLPEQFAKAFKPADIRGIYPTEIDEEVTYRSARAFVQLYKLKNVVLGRDMRCSSPSLRDAFVRGVTDQGANVLDIGLVDTPAVYYASGMYKMFGAMITASHNPAEYNGIKFVKVDAVPLTDRDGLNDIKKLVRKNDFKTPKKKGTVKKKSIMSEYKKYLHSLVSIKAPRDIVLVADAGNGMATVLEPIMKKGFPIDFHPLFFELDGTFPNRGSNPTLAKNIKPIQAEIKKIKPDFGVAFDGDVDRVAFFDENGKLINSAVIGAMISKLLLQKYTEAKPALRAGRPQQKLKFVYTNFTSRSLYESIKENGGTPIRARVGHAFIKKLMRDRGVVFGCEHSAHFFFKENFYADSGILTLLYVLDIYSDAVCEGKTFSDLVKEFQRYHQSEELLVKVPNKNEVLKKATKHYKKLAPKKLDTFDGIYADFGDYWFCLKKSITEDALKFVVESRSKKVNKEKQEEILALMKKLDN